MTFGIVIIIYVIVFHIDISRDHLVHRVYANESNDSISDYKPAPSPSHHILGSRPVTTLTIKLVNNQHKRLGNVLFQVMSSWGIAIMNNVSFFVEHDPSILDIFPHLPGDRGYNQYNYSPKRITFLPEVPIGYFKTELFELKDQNTTDGVLGLTGYFQSWKYFAHTGEKKIKEKLLFQEDIESKVILFFQRNASHKNGTIFYIGVHIRRGDFTSWRGRKLGFHVSTSKYINRGIQHMITNQYEADRSFVIIICTNDMPWAETNIPADYGGHAVVFSPFSSPADDLCLLSHCNGSVITGGSYGWWAAYLAAGPVVYDQQYPTKGSKLASGYNLEDYYPPSWIGL